MRGNLRDYDLFFFDCETGGLSPNDSDMVEVAAIRTDPTGEHVRDEYSAMVLPQLPVHPAAAAVNGYSAEVWRATGARPAAAVALPALLRLAQNAVFVAHRAEFDWGFLQATMERARAAGAWLRWRSTYHRLCTYSLSLPLLRYGLVPDLKLQTLATYFGIEHGTPAAPAHTALADVRACRGLYRRLMPAYDRVAEAWGTMRADVRATLAAVDDQDPAFTTPPPLASGTIVVDLVRRHGTGPTIVTNDD